MKRKTHANFFFILAHLEPDPKGEPTLHGFTSVVTTNMYFMYLDHILSRTQVTFPAPTYQIRISMCSIRLSETVCQWWETAGDRSKSCPLTSIWICTTNQVFISIQCHHDHSVKKKMTQEKKMSLVVVNKIYPLTNLIIILILKLRKYHLQTKKCFKPL